MLAMTFYGLTIIDLSVIFVYFIAVIIIGYRTTKKVKNQEDYFLAGRRLGKFIMTFASFGQGTSPETAVTTTTMVTTNGAAGLAAQMTWGVMTVPVYWMMIGWFRRLRILTMAEFFRVRYGSTVMAGFFAIQQFIYFTLIGAFAFVCMSKTVAAIVVKPIDELTIVQKVEYDKAVELKGLERADFISLSETDQERLSQLRLENPKMEFSYINEKVITVICAVMVLIYALGGGLEAAFLTDVLQGVFTIILALLLVPFAMIKVNKMCGTSGVLGPFQAMHDRLPEAIFELFGSPAVMEFTWYWIITFAFVVVLTGIAGADNIAFGAAKDELAARTAAVSGVFIKRYCTVIWGLIAMFALVLYSGVVRNPDYVWGYASRDLLSPMGVGLVGLMIACLMAALMAVVDAKMVQASGLLTISVYKPLFPGKSEKNYITVGRILGVFYVICSVLIATNFRTVFELAKFSYAFNCIVAAAFIFGILWRRANRIAAWASMTTMFVVMLLLPMLLPLLPGLRANTYLLKTTHPDPVVRLYTAHSMDITRRQESINKWDELNKLNQAQGDRPELLVEGQKFEKTYVLPQKSVFWMEGIELKDGKKQGIGMPKIELIVIDKLGFDLSKNSYALNETILMLVRIILPFIVMITVSLLTKRDDKEMVRHFYARMMTLVDADPEIDARQVQMTFDEPDRLNHTKIWPNSNWEFKRWNKTDVKGLCWTLLGCSGIVVALYLIVTLGK